LVHFLIPRRLLRLVTAAGRIAAALLGGVPPRTLAQTHGVGPSGMGEMGGQMGEHGGGQQALYPSLVTAPPADPAAGEAALRDAHRRMTSGLPLLREWLDQAARALQAGDAQGMRAAIDQSSDGLNLYRSGVPTHLAVSAGHTPAQAGLAWYRGQLRLPAATAMPVATEVGAVLSDLSARQGFGVLAPEDASIAPLFSRVIDRSRARPRSLPNLR
jgi:hypothetical protein